MTHFRWIIRLFGILAFGTRFYEAMFVGDPVSDQTMSGSREDQFGSLLSNDSLRLDLYKFHQDRVEKIRSRLWTTLAWLAALQGALLAFMFEKLNLRLGQWLLPSIEQPKMALVLSIFGALFASYTLKIIDNGTAHIESNWRRSDIAIKKRPPHEIREFRQRIQDRSFTELQVMGRLFMVVIIVQVVLVAVSAWSLVRLSGMAEKIDWFVQSPPASTAAAPSAPPAAAPAAPPASTAAAPSAPPASLPAEAETSEANRRQIQEALHRVDYYRGPVDGIFGPLTRAAIRRFQREIGADLTGYLTAEEANRLVSR